MNPTQKPSVTDVAAPTPADILRAAALYLQRHGWTQDVYYARDDIPTPPACAVGAIAVTVYGNPIEPLSVIDHPDRHLFELAQDLLSDYLNRHFDTSPLDLTLAGDTFAWNDTPGRSVAEVISALHDAADEWDRTHTPAGVA